MDWIHSATALGATSVHLTVGMSAYTRADLVDALLPEVGDNAALRTSLPLGIDLRDPGALAPIVEETVRALIQTLQQSDASRPAAMLSARFDADTRAEPVAPLATLEALATLDASSPVRWRGSLAGAHRDG